MSVPDNHIKAGIFTGKVIMVDRGKILSLLDWLSLKEEQFTHGGARVSNHARRWYMLVASVSPLADH